MPVVNNLLSEESLEALRSLKGRCLKAIFTDYRGLREGATETFVMRTEAEDVCVALHGEAFEDPLVYDAISRCCDVSTMTVAPCARAETEGYVGDIIHSDGSREPLHRRAHCIDKTIRRIVVLIETTWFNNPNEDDSETIPMPENERVYLREVRAIAIVFDDEVLLFDKSICWSILWQISRTPGPTLQLPKDFTVYEAIDL